MTDAYRDKALSCPACTAPMQSRQSTLAVVDVCPDCEGMWIDWFDGEIASVAGSVGDLPASHVPTRDDGACPLCAAPLLATPYGDDAVVILRCGECAGAFVPRSALHKLVLEGPPHSTPEGEPGMIARIVEWARALVE